MKWLETDSIPEACTNCSQGECYNCDMAGQRWVRSKEDELRTNRKLLLREIERLERKIAEIDAQLEKVRK